MSEITAVPLRPIARRSLAKLWVGIAAVALVAVGVAYAGTQRQVALGTPPSEFLAANAGREGVRTTASGLQYKVLAEGRGAKATAQDIAVIDYEGRLADGEVFDASSRHGGPAPMPVAGNIPGFSEGLQLMNKGAKYRFWIPPQLAYGEQGAGGGVIPPNALLVFDVTVHEIVPQSALGGMGGPGGAPGM